MIRSKSKIAFIYFGYFLIFIQTIIPVYFMFKYSISDRTSLLTGGKPLPLWPFSPTFESYKYIFSDSSFLNVIFTSIKVSFLALLISILIGVLASYALSKLEDRPRQIIMLMLISIRFFPDIISVIPYTELIIKLHLDGTIFAAALGHALLALPYVIFIIEAGFSSLPKELEEQAVNLGASKLYTLQHILIPLILPSITVASIYVFILSWDEFVFSYFTLGYSSIETLPVYLKKMLSFQPPQNILMSISAILTLPAIIFSFFIQKYIINDINRGAIK